MRHSLALYQSNKAEFSERPTGIFWMNAAFVVALIVSCFFTAFLPLALAAGGVHTALWMTNQQWGMNSKEIEFWHKYQSLPKNYRKALDLTPKYVRELDGAAWSVAKQKVDSIYTMRQQNASDSSLPDDLMAKFVAIEQAERDAAQRRRETEAYIKDNFKELGA